MEVQCNIIGDYVQILRSRLSEFGYTECSIDGIEDDYDLTLAYFRALRRRVPSVSRNVLKAIDFKCPPEYSSELADIEQKIRSGEDINPYLSRQSRNLGFNDDLLNDWAIQHLHLKRRGTKELLYVYFTKQSAYFITIGDHHTFANQESLRILHDNWPEVLKQYADPTIKSVIPDDLTDEQRRQLRKSGYNMGVDMMPDGTAYMLIGGGRTLSGDNAYDVRRANHLHNWARLQTSNIKDCISEIVTTLRTKHGLGIEEPIVLKLKVDEWETDSRWFLCDEHGRFTIPIQGPWKRLIDP